MTDAWKRVPNEMLRAKAKTTLLLRARVEDALRKAGVPEAQFGQDEDDLPICIQAGYHISNFGRQYVSVTLLGRSLVADEIRQGERDALGQQARAALDAAGFTVRLSPYGNLVAVEDRAPE